MPLGDQFPAVFQFELAAVPIQVEVCVVGVAAWAEGVTQTAHTTKTQRITNCLLRIALSLTVPATKGRPTSIIADDQWFALQNLCGISSTATTQRVRRQAKTFGFLLCLTIIKRNNPRFHAANAVSSIPIGSFSRVDRGTMFFSEPRFAGFQARNIPGQ